MGSTKSEKEANTLSGSDLCLVICITVFVLNSAQSSGKIGSVTAKNSLKESFWSIFCFIIQGKCSSWKGYGNLTRMSFLS